MRLPACSRSGLAAAFSLLLILPACQRSAPEHGALSAERWVRTELYFGLSTGDGGKVSDEQWRDFLDSCLTPAFPDGLTVVEASGQYRDSAGKVQKEGTKLAIILHHPGAAVDAKLKSVIAEYKRRFKQESVLRSSAPAAAVFE